MINVKLAFENGNCDIDLLKAVLIEMSEELNSLRSNGALKTKHNEKIDFSGNFGIESNGDFAGNYFLKTVNELRKIDSVYIFYDQLDLTGEVITVRLPAHYIIGYDKNNVYLSTILPKDKIVNLYITYEY